MNSYIIISLGSILGMLLLIAAKSAYIRQNSKYELGFVDAFKVYTTKYTGPIVVGIIVIVITMFILPDIIAHSMVSDADGSQKYNKAIQSVIHWLRPASVALGVLAQGIGFLIIRKGEKYLRDMEKQVETKKDEINKD